MGSWLAYLISLINSLRRRLRHGSLFLGFMRDIHCCWPPNPLRLARNPWILCQFGYLDNEVSRCCIILISLLPNPTSTRPQWCPARARTQGTYSYWWSLSMLIPFNCSFSAALSQMAPRWEAKTQIKIIQSDLSKKADWAYINDMALNAVMSQHLHVGLNESPTLLFLN